MWGGQVQGIVGMKEPKYSEKFEKKSIVFRDWVNLLLQEF
jgi:hypothetical protein